MIFFFCCTFIFILFYLLYVKMSIQMPRDFDFWFRSDKYVEDWFNKGNVKIRKITFLQFALHSNDDLSMGLLGFLLEFSSNWLFKVEINFKMKYSSRSHRKDNFGSVVENCFDFLKTLWICKIRPIKWNPNTFGITWWYHDLS